MPAKNIDHDAVRDALVADGWTITHDPLTLVVGERPLHIDLGAELVPLGAEKGDRRIAVEIQTFGSPSPVADLQQAVGQFTMYRIVLGDQQPDRTLYLAVSETVYNGILSEPLGSQMIAGANLKVLVFDPTRRSIVRWTS